MMSVLLFNQFVGASPAVARNARICAMMVILATGVFYSATVREGHDWGDDFSMYIRHASNIAEGAPYAQTGYVYNPNLIIGPTMYPPVFPLLLAPVYKLRGLNLNAMKAVIILLFLVSLTMIYAALKSELSWPYPVAVLAIIGFNPLLWQLKDNIISDWPFLLTTYLSLYLIHRAYRTGFSPNRLSRSQVFHSLLIGISIYLAYGTRTVGLVLVPSLLIFDLIRNRRPSLLAMTAVVLAGALIFLQKTVLHSETAAGYADQLGGDGEPVSTRLWIMLRHVWLLIQAFGNFWANGHSLPLKWGLLTVLAALAGIGYFLRIRKLKQITCFETIIPFYLLPLIILPIELEDRYLMPVLPLLLMYAVIGLQTLTRPYGKEGIAFAALGALILFSYAGQYARLDLKTIPDGVTKTESLQLFDYVKRGTAPNDVILFRKPRALNLFTGRTGALWHKSSDDAKMWDYFRRINASYLIVGPPHIEPGDQQQIEQFVERNRRHLHETFANADFHVYRLNQRPEK